MPSGGTIDAMAVRSPPGTTNEAGDRAAGDNTGCDVILCAVNEAVSANACVACPAGTTNDANDDATDDNKNDDEDAEKAKEKEEEADKKEVSHKGAGVVATPHGFWHKDSHYRS